MKLKAMKFSEDENPSEITVSMSIEEAVWIAKVAGQQRGASPHNEIYACLTGTVFDRCWEDGVDGAAREFGVITPPIVYPQE